MRVCTYLIAAAVNAQVGCQRHRTAEPEDGVQDVEDEGKPGGDGEVLPYRGGQEVEEGEHAEDGAEEAVVDDGRAAGFGDHVADNGHDEEGPEELGGEVRRWASLDVRRQEGRCGAYLEPSHGDVEWLCKRHGGDVVVLAMALVMGVKRGRVLSVWCRIGKREETGREESNAVSAKQFVGYAKSDQKQRRAPLRHPTQSSDWPGSSKTLNSASSSRVHQR